jgi:hypothetical protein
MRHGNKLRPVFYKICLRSGTFYCIFMGAKLNFHQLRLGQQEPVDIIHGIAGTFNFT